MKDLARCAMIVALISLVGCLPFGLGDPEKSTADDKLVGVWLSEPKDGEQQMFIVSGFDARTMLVAQYSFKRNGDAIEASDRGNYKAWITPIGDKQFITLEAKTANILEKEPEFISAKYDLKGDQFIAQGLNVDTVKKANIDSAEKLTKYVTEHLQDAELLIDPVTYTKVSKDKKEEVEKILQAFHE